MNAAKRIQVNLKLDKDSSIPELKNIPKSTMLPIYYAEQRGAVTAELANEFKDTVFTVRYGILGTVWAITGLAGKLPYPCGSCSRQLEWNVGLECFALSSGSIDPLQSHPLPLSSSAMLE